MDESGLVQNVASYRGLEIASQFSPLRSKEMTRESPVSSPSLARRSELNGHDIEIQQQIIQLKKQHQIQQQILLQHFQQQQQQLAEQHEQQLRRHLKVQEEQEREREAREKERIESIKKKGKHQQSAVASSEVKQKLQGFLLNKKRVEAAAAAANGQTSASQPPFRNWSVVQGSSGEPGHGPGPGPGPGPGATPYRLNPHLVKYEDEYPLRKTASEPNLLKVRLKHRVFGRRESPIARRKDKIAKRKSHLAIESGSSNPDSGPNSPPVQGVSQLSPPPGKTTPIQEEGESRYPESLNRAADQSGSLSDLSSLYSSPSMPNISLGRPHNSSNESRKLAPVSEAEVRAAFAARLGMPLTGQMLPGTLPFYPTLPVIESESSNPTSPSFMPKQISSIEQPSHTVNVYDPQTRLQAGFQPVEPSLRLGSGKGPHRPLGRTQSAPLPLGHPMLAAHPPAHSIVHYEESAIPQSLHHINHNLLKQQIRQTVLTRVSSKAQSLASPHLENTPEFDDNSEVIDLTDKSSSRERLSEEGESDISAERQHRDRESFLQQQRDLMMRHSLQTGTPAVSRPTSLIARPLARALSSPLVTLGVQNTDQPPPAHTSPKLCVGGVVTTGLAFDSAMLKHACTCGDNGWHPEHSGRLQSIWARLVETGLAHRCARIRPRKASLDEIQVCHSEPHTLLFGTNPPNRQKLDMSKLAQLPIKSFVRLSCGGIGVDSDTMWNELHTASAARMAVGSVVDLAFKTATGDVRNGFAVVRPPGHHAEQSQAMGFCFFNSVAIATRLLQQRLDLRRILIIDWDVHHGNGTQQMFYDDGRVLFLSLHRHDDGNFFPGTGGPTECGIGAGLGYTVNISWSGGLNPPMGDAEYIAAFRTIVMPIAREFNPDVIMVSAGFDAALGHSPPLGGYKLSPACFGYMTKQLMQLADAKMVLALEGGYDLTSICDAAEECVRALLGDEPTPLSEDELKRPPNQNAVDTLQKTIAIQLPHWPCLKQLAHTVSCSAVSAMFNERDETETETVTAMASLSMQHQQLKSSEECSREASVEPMEEDEIK